MISFFLAILFLLFCENYENILTYVFNLNFEFLLFQDILVYLKFYLNELNGMISFYKKYPLFSVFLMWFFSYFLINFLAFYLELSLFIFSLHVVLYELYTRDSWVLQYFKYQNYFLENYFDYLSQENIYSMKILEFYAEYSNLFILISVLSILIILKKYFKVLLRLKK